jgi:hypothetical protein
MSRCAGLVIVWVWAPLACAHERTHPVDVDTQTLPADVPVDCTTAVEREALRWPMVFWAAGERIFVYAGDEIWRVEIRDRTAWYQPRWVGARAAERHYSPFGERRGFEVSLTCDGTTRTLDGQECETDEGVVVYLASQGLGALGSVDSPCELRVELRDEEQRWVHVEDGVLVRPGLRAYFHAAY